MASTDDLKRPTADPAYLVLDTESVPDGKLLSMVKYPGEPLTEDEAIRRAQDEARKSSASGSDFLPVSFQIPIAICVLRVGADYRLQSIQCLDAPEFRTPEIVRKFWQGVGLYPRAQLVSFNGRGFDLPLLELAAFRYGCAAKNYFAETGRKRFGGSHLDLLELLTNYGAIRLAGGLNMLSKILGKPGKMEVSGDQVYDMYLAGKKQMINDYCMFDTLDTYFIFLRTRVLAGMLTLEQEQSLVREEAKAWIAARIEKLPALQQYLNNWGDWQPWP